MGGSAVAVRLAVAANASLEEACAVAGVPLLDAEALLGEVDEADPVQVAALVRATLDAMALQNADILRAMEGDLGKRMKPLRVDGGAAANNLLMQIQADVLGRRIIRPQVIETTVAGACYLAGLGVGLWEGPAQIKKIWRIDREFSVTMSAGARRKRLKSWDEALRRTLL